MTSADMAPRAAFEHRNESPRDCVAQAVAWLKTKVNRGRAVASAALKRCAALLEEWDARRRERAFLATLKEIELRDMGLSSADRWREVNKPFWQA
jgi:uncharacterized protein YjiS (DUF1127 family)